MGAPCFDETAQPPYEFVAESLPPITEHAANSRNDSRPLATPWDSSFSAVRRLASCLAPVSCGFRNANVDSRRFLVENFDRQPPHSARRLDDGFVFVDRLRRETVIRKCLLSFFLLGPERGRQ